MDYIRFGSVERVLIMLPGLGDALQSVRGTALPMAFMYRLFAKDFTVYMFSRKNDLPIGYTTRDMAKDQAEAMEMLGIEDDTPETKFDKWISEKMGDKITPDMLQSKISFSSIGNLSFSALKVGCLLIGLGLGILVAFFIHYNMMDFCDDRRIQSSLYASCVLLFGGIGLLTAFLIELKINKNK